MTIDTAASFSRIAANRAINDSRRAPGSAADAASALSSTVAHDNTFGNGGRRVKFA